MATTIKLKNSVTTTNAPSSLVQGEVAINITDKKVWVGNAATTPIQLLGDGASLNFTSLSLSGNLAFTGTGNRITGDFSNATLANRVAFQTSTTNDNTFIPVLANGTGTITGIELLNGSDATNASVLQLSSRATEARIAAPIRGTGTYVPLTFFTAAGERLRIDTSGNVGIGTSSPTVRLDVGGGGEIRSTDSTVQTFMQSSSGGGGGFIGTRSNHYLQFRTNDANRMIITAAGDVGIGTSSPTSKLDVNGIATAKQAIIADGANGNIQFGSTSTYNIVGGVDNEGIRYNVPTGMNHQFRTNATERMRITSGGTLCVGTTNEDSSRANIVHTGTPSRVLRVGAESGSFTGTMYEGYGARTTTNGTYKLIEVLNGDASGLFRVLDSGNAQNTNNSYGGTSDIKLKENIVDATPKLADLCKVKVRHYNFKNKPDEKQIGVVAQELEEVFAGLVEETADKDKDGNDLGTTTKSVKYSVFVPMLIKAIQEQQAMIEELKQEVATLKGV